MSVSRLVLARQPTIQCRVWIESGKKVKEIGERGYGNRLITRENDAQEIAGEITKITWSIRSFTVGFSFHMLFHSAHDPYRSRA